MRDTVRLIEIVESPVVFTRIVVAQYAQHAGRDFLAYVRTTLMHNQRVGGRFNAPNTFGVLYAASEEATAWAELHARFVRKGLTGLPSFMGLLLMRVSAGRFIDLNRASARVEWHVSLAELAADHPTDAEREACWDLGRNARAVVDFIRSRSARGLGDSVPIFVGGPRHGALRLELASVDPRRATPLALRQDAAEQWD